MKTFRIFATALVLLLSASTLTAEASMATMDSVFVSEVDMKVLGKVVHRVQGGTLSWKMTVANCSHDTVYYHIIMRILDKDGFVVATESRSYKMQLPFGFKNYLGTFRISPATGIALADSGSVQVRLEEDTVTPYLKKRGLDK